LVNKVIETKNRRIDMKKSNFVLLFAALLVALMSTSGFAAEVHTTTVGESFDVGEDDDLTFNFSPGVLGQYITATDTNDQQWFAIATVHSGGETAYATASNLASMYTKDVASGNQPVTTSNLTTVLSGIPTQEASANTWTDWAKK
jgi:nitrogen fixation protein FixH